MKQEPNVPVDSVHARFSVGERAIGAAVCACVLLQGSYDLADRDLGDNPNLYRWMLLSIWHQAHLQPATSASDAVLDIFRGVREESFERTVDTLMKQPAMIAIRIMAESKDIGPEELARLRRVFESDDEAIRHFVRDVAKTYLTTVFGCANGIEFMQTRWQQWPGT